MKRGFILFLTWLIFQGGAFAIEVVYPKSNPAKIDAGATFFIGSADPQNELRINDESVEVSSNGAFAKRVQLKLGRNDFILKSGEETQTYSIERPFPIGTKIKPPELVEYPVIDNFYVKTERAPLRMTPVDGGINRLSHLPKDVQLLINGEKGDFYRVYLNSKMYGWIFKKDVEQRDEKTSTQSAKLICSKISENSEFFTYEFDMERKEPFVLKENSSLNGLSLQIFNVEGQPDSTYSQDFTVPRLIGYDIYYDNSNLILKIRKFPQLCLDKPLCGFTVVVDAGHGGSESGAIGCCGDKEKDINLQIAKNLQAVLLSRGAKVVMTREDDVDVALSDRVKTIKDTNASISISIHANALPDGGDPIKNKGTSVYYYYPQTKPLADTILSTMTSELGTQNDKVRQGSLALVRNTSALSLLIEVAYMINPDDYAMLTNPEFQANCAKSIADGIEKYLLQN